MENFSARKSLDINVASVAKKEVHSKLSLRIADAVFAISIGMLFLGLPIFFTGLPLQGVVFEKQMYFYFWILALLLIWFIKSVILGEMKIRRTPLDILIFLFWAIYLLATIFSVDRWHSFMGLSGDPSRGFVNVTILILAYYIIMSNFSERIFHWIVGTLSVASLFVSLWSVLDVLEINFLPAKIAEYAPFSLLGTVSGLVMFVAMMLPIIITFIFKLRDNQVMQTWLRNSLTVVLSINLALNIFLLLALHSFVPWIVIVLGVGFFLVFILARIVRPSKSWLWLPIATFVFLVVVWLVGDGFRVARINLPMEVSLSQSLSWQIAKESVKNNFFLGTGAASYGYDFSLYKSQDFNLSKIYNLRFYQGAGLVFEALSTIGVVGLLALLLMVLSFVSLSLYYLIARAGKDKLYSLGFVTATLIFIMFAVSVRMNGAIISIGILLATVALAVMLRENNLEEDFFKLSFKTSPKYILASIFIFMIVITSIVYLFIFIGKIYTADIYAGIAMRQPQVSENGSIAKIAYAVNLNPRENKYYTNIGQQYMLLANNETLKDTSVRDVEIVRNYFNNAIANVTHSRDLAPNDVATVEALAQVYKNAETYVAGSLKLAEDNYNRALELEPNNPLFFLELGKIKFAQALTAKDDDEKKLLAKQARDLFQKSIEKKNNFALGYYQLAIAQSALGEKDEAIETMTKAASLDANNSNYFFSLAKLYQQRGKNDDNKHAENIFKEILKIDDREINTHFSLATLYEKMNEKDKAIVEYARVIELLPADNADMTDNIRVMIENVKNGVSNLTTTEPRLISN